MNKYFMEKSMMQKLTMVLKNMNGIIVVKLKMVEIIVARPTMVKCTIILNELWVYSLWLNLLG